MISHVGKDVQDLPTPCLVIDLDTLSANLVRMQQLVSSYGRTLRPHVKTHKCSVLARMQLEAGAAGVTCATVGEAEAMAAAGIRDILIANQVLTLDKLRRLANLKEHADAKFLVDSVCGIEAAAAAASVFDCSFEVLVEVDIGGNRCGVQSPAEALMLVERVLDSRGLQFGGIQGYNGATNYIRDPQECERQNRRSDEILRASVDAVRTVHAVPRISGAGTGNAPYFLEYGTLTEIQAGSYVYSDTTYRELAPAYKPALYVLATTLSRPTATRVVMDVGLKAMGTEFSEPEAVLYPHLEAEHFSEEHLQWRVPNGAAPQIGEKVLLIPSHCCTTVNLHRRCFIVQAGRVVDVWNIDAF